MNNRLLNIIIGLVVFCGTVSAHLQGIVVDEKGEPLVGANVYWAESTVGSATDEQGLFEIEPIRQSKLLVTSYLGYHNDTILITNRDVIKIVLIPDDVLDEVVITERQLDVLRSRLAAFDIQTIGAGELCHAACCNLSESFETNASVDVAYADAATGMKQIRMLGLSGTYVQLLGENCPSVRGLAQSFGMEYVPGSWIESIQISKGTSSVLNGYEAIAGQINVEYLKPQKQNPIAVDIMLNTELDAEININGGWDIPIPKDPLMGTLSTGILAHYSDESWATDDNSDGFLDIPKHHSVNLLNRWYYKNDSYSFQFLLRGLYDQRSGGQQHASCRATVTLPDTPYLIELNTKRIDGFMKHGIMLDEESGMSIGIVTAASYHHQTNRYGVRQWNAAQVNAYLNAIFQNTWEGGDILGGGVDNDHQLSAGLSVNYDKYIEDINLTTALLTTPTIGLNRQEVTPGIFAEYTYKIAESFSMIAGVRADWSNRYGFFCTPRLNVRYNPFPWWTLRGSVGLGYRSPNLIADYAQYLPSNRQMNIAEFTPAQEKSLNTGLTSTFDIPIADRNLQITAEYYYTRFMDGIIADLDRSRYGISFYNLSDIAGAQSYSHSAQIEATMEILRGWTMTAAFRYTDVKQTTWNESVQAYQLRDKALQNQFKAVITTSYQTPKKTWQFDATVQFNGPGRMYDGFVDLYGSHQYTTKNGILYHKWYPQLMAQVTKYFKHNVSLYVGAENMTDFKQDNPVLGDRNEAGVINTASPDFDAATVWAPTDGWKIYAGVTWHL